MPEGSAEVFVGGASRKKAYTGVEDHLEVLVVGESDFLIGNNRAHHRLSLVVRNGLVSDWHLTRLEA